jgi:hypothetical protein
MRRVLKTALCIPQYPIWTWRPQTVNRLAALRFGGGYATAARMRDEDAAKKFAMFQHLNLPLSRLAHIRLIKLIGR